MYSMHVFYVYSWANNNLLNGSFYQYLLNNFLETYFGLWFLKFHLTQISLSVTDFQVNKPKSTKKMQRKRIEINFSKYILWLHVWSIMLSKQNIINYICSYKQKWKINCAQAQSVMDANTKKIKIKIVMLTA